MTDVEQFVFFLLTMVNTFECQNLLFNFTKEIRDKICMLSLIIINYLF
jgi:hypothetical protein